MTLKWISMCVIRNFGADGVAHEVWVDLPSKCEALSSNPRAPHLTKNKLLISSKTK
jgi:hypothetical protein